MEYLEILLNLLLIIGICEIAQSFLTKKGENKKWTIQKQETPIQLK